MFSSRWAQDAPLHNWEGEVPPEPRQGSTCVCGLARAPPLDGETTENHHETTQNTFTINLAANPAEHSAFRPEKTLCPLCLKRPPRARPLRHPKDATLHNWEGEVPPEPRQGSTCVCGLARAPPLDGEATENHHETTQNTFTINLTANPAEHSAFRPEKTLCPLCLKRPPRALRCAISGLAILQVTGSN